ncbi:DEKNAAC102767 [Brettanomyces naardenensis]|uniref:DEKNAAC102767 n=1 Tax=Brettanomyces naardenensis TaxID=13370 RepID=A0A448YKN5_BRENA|nr:DEKNAAC102767 [Brettanomyces naardenensis]
MQYVGRAIGSVSKTWSSINPATLSGAIDVIVVEHGDGELHCSPFHVRFGKFQLLRPSQKKVEFRVNGEPTDIPMKLDDGGEAFFVFETDADVPPELQTSPVISAASSPSVSPRSNASSGPLNKAGEEEEPDYLDIGEGAHDEDEDESTTQIMKKLDINSNSSDDTEPSLERARKLSNQLTKKNIPSSVEDNGDVLLDMHGYKSDAKDIHDSDKVVKQLLVDEFGPDVNYDSLIDKDLDGNIRILNNVSTSEDISVPESHMETPTPTSEEPTSAPSEASVHENNDDNVEGQGKTVHFKTLRLTSEQLTCLSLKEGQNTIEYRVNRGKSVITANLYLWKWNVPIVISDIDGTITKSDTLGHFFTMLGKDWTHEGVARLFTDISSNGYNIIYLTARSVGLSDLTRSYLTGVYQEGQKLPSGPVILSPDRTIEALKREIVLKKPQVFKMACLSDIEALYFPDEAEGDGNEGIGKFGLYGTIDSDSEELSHSSSEFTDINTNTSSLETGTATGTGSGISTEPLTGMDILEIVNSSPTKKSSRPSTAFPERETKTPFYAGFGNRITDALSYRSVGVPSSRIFTINPDGEVHMELLEMAGYKSSYVSIGELVDQFFPPVNLTKTNKGSDIVGMNNTSNQFSDVNFWRAPIADISDLSETDSVSGGSNNEDSNEKTENLEESGNAEASSIGSLSPRLKSFFRRSRSQDSDVSAQGNEEAMIDEGGESFGEDDENVGEEGEDDLDEDPDYVYEDDPEIEYDEEGAEEDEGEEGSEYEEEIEEVAGEKEDLGDETEEDTGEEKNSLYEVSSADKTQPVGLGITGNGSSSPPTIMMDPTNIQGSIIKMQREEPKHS